MKKSVISKKEKVKIIRKMLDEFFPNPEIPLHHSSLFELLIAVLLSAQCQDARVNKVTPNLFALADTPEKMAQLKLETIEKTIGSLGLAKQKAKNIHRLAQILTDKFSGKVPGTLKELESLPGVGHKTASVVMIQGFHKPAFPVDTHIHRLAKRWGLSKGKSVVQTERDLKALFPKSSWEKVHLQIIYYARQYCPAIKHDKTGCPICLRLAE